MEYFDIVDEQGLPTGEIIERSEAHRIGARHRTAHVWILRFHEGRPQALMQKRSMNKDSFPGRWDTSSAGHIPAGCEPLESALRELKEELGIEAAPDELRFIGTFRNQYEKEFHGRCFRDNEYANIFVYEKPVEKEDLTLQASELEDADWFDWDKVLEAGHTRPGWLCAPLDGILVVDRYIRSIDGNRDL